MGKRKGGGGGGGSPFFGQPRKISLLPFFFNLAPSSSLLGRYAHVYIRSVIVRYFRQRSFFKPLWWLTHCSGSFSREFLSDPQSLSLFLRSVMFVITGSLERGGIYIILEKGEGRSRPPPLLSSALLLAISSIFTIFFPSKIVWLVSSAPHTQIYEHDPEQPGAVYTGNQSTFSPPPPPRKLSFFRPSHLLCDANFLLSLPLPRRHALPNSHSSC